MPITKIVGGFDDKAISLSKKNKPKQTMYGTRKKLSKPKTKNKINNIRNRFILTKKNKQIKGRIIRDIRTLFQTEEQ